MSEVSIYALCEPDTGEVRYIGQTRSSLRQRLAGHLASPSNGLMLAWLTALAVEGKRPAITLVETAVAPDAGQRERFHITSYIERGAALLNSAGVPGVRRVSQGKRSPKGKATDQQVVVRAGLDFYERITRLTKADDRTVAYIARRAIEMGLPLLEQDMAERGKVQA